MTETVYARNTETGTVQSLTGDLLPALLDTKRWVQETNELVPAWEQVSEDEAIEADPRVFGKADPDVEHVRDWGIGDDGQIVRYGSEVQWAGWSA